MSRPPPSRNWKTEWLILLAALLVLAGFLGHNIWQEHEAVEAREVERLNRLALIVETLVQRQFDTINRALESLQGDWFYWQTQANGMERAQLRLNTFSRSLIGVRNLMILDANGRAMLASRTEVAGTDFSQRDYFRWAAQTPDKNTAFLSKPFRTVLNTWGITLVRPLVGPDGSFAGVITANLDRGVIDDLLSSLHYAQDMWISVNHSDGQVFLVNPHRPELEGRDLDQPGSLFRRHRDSGKTFNLFKDKVYLTNNIQFLAIRSLQLATPTMVNSLMVAVSRDPDAIFADWRRRSYQLAILFGLLGLATIGGLFSLQHYQRRIDSERQQHFNRLNLLVESVPGMLYQFILEADGSHQFVYVSPHVQDIYSLSVDEVTTDASRLYARIHPDDRNRIQQSVLDSAASLSPWKEQYRILSPQQGERWLAAHSKPQALKRGAILWHGYVHDITEIKQQELALQQAIEAVKAASRSKDQFIANVSHEVRTPLNATLGHLQLLKQTDLDTNQQSFVANAETAASLLLAILNDILDLSKIEAGRLSLSPAPFSLEELLGNLESILTAMAAKKVLEIRIKLDTRLPRVLQADALRLQQVLLNLAGNAIKFTERGYICLLVQQIERSPNQVLVQFIVEDSGIGIADDRLNAIFENFEQEDASTSRRFGGTGLGLPISQRLVQLMGGELHVSSQLGQGSSFAFRLRLPWSPEDQQLLRQDQPLEQHFPESRFDHEAEAEPLAGLRILVTEDNALNQQLVQTLLSQAGTEVVLANNGQEAVETIKRGLPIIHAVLMDIQMPVMDGYEATRLIRTQAGDALPIIAMTANSLASERETYLKAGMDDHIAKPFNIQDLIELLLRHLDRSFIPASRSTSTTMLDGSIDSQAALKRMNNNEELYARLLRDFVASQAEIPEQVEEALAHNDTTTALRLLHSLKGLAATLGIMELHKAAAAAEAELKLSASSPAWPTALARLKARLSTDVQQIQTVAGRLNTAAEPLPVKTDSDQAILLLVDDQPINLEVLKGIFAGDYGLLEAQSGAQTLQLCRSLPRPDLVLLDVLMPDMDGLEVCRQLKADPLTADIPIIFITAQTTADEETAALECGGVDFISKPITPAVIQARVRTQLTLKQQRDQLQALAMIDGLTQIANRRHFDEALQTECQRAQRHQSHLALLLIDIDHFKAYNDHYGHQQGDICLQQVAATLAACCRRALDLVARYGGEEFSCLLPDCDLDSARIKAEELRQAIAALHLPHASSPVAPHVSISIGIAVCLSASANPQQLIAAADKALYAAKAAGRNRVSF